MMFCSEMLVVKLPQMEGNYRYVTNTEDLCFALEESVH